MEQEGNSVLSQCRACLLQSWWPYPELVTLGSLIPLPKAAKSNFPILPSPEILIILFPYLSSGYNRFREIRTSRAAQMSDRRKNSLGKDCAHTKHEMCIKGNSNTKPFIKKQATVYSECVQKVFLKVQDLLSAE